MLFQKNIEPRCTYCQRGTPLDEEKILCTKHAASFLSKSFGNKTF